MSDWNVAVKLALNDSVEVIYESNNSGGIWWLNDTDWKKLEEAGWHLEDHGLGVTWRATKTFSSLRAGVEEWEKVTGMDSAAEGCPCCGRPHGFFGEDAYGNTLYWPE